MWSGWAGQPQRPDRSLVDQADTLPSAQLTTFLLSFLLTTACEEICTSPFSPWTFKCTKFFSLDLRVSNFFYYGYKRKGGTIEYTPIYLRQGLFILSLMSKTSSIAQTGNLSLNSQIASSSTLAWSFWRPSSSVASLKSLSWGYNNILLALVDTWTS